MENETSLPRAQYPFIGNGSEYMGYGTLPISEQLPFARSGGPEEIVFAGFGTLLSVIGVLLHGLSLYFQYYDKDALKRPSLLMALSVVEIINCLRNAISSLIPVIILVELAKVIAFNLFYFAILYLLIMFMITTDRVLRVYKGIHYDPIKTSKIWRLAIAVASAVIVVLVVVENIFSIAEHAYIVYNILEVALSLEVMITYCYIGYHMRQSRLNPPVPVCRMGTFQDRPTSNDTKEDGHHDQKLEAHKFKEICLKRGILVANSKKTVFDGTAVVAKELTTEYLRARQREFTRKQILRDMKRTIGSVPSLILLTFVPLVAVPDLTLALTHAISAVPSQRMRITARTCNTLGFITDAFVYILLKPSIRRKISREFRARIGTL